MPYPEVKIIGILIRFNINLTRKVDTSSNICHCLIVILRDYSGFYKFFFSFYL